MAVGREAVLLSQTDGTEGSVDTFPGAWGWGAQVTCSHSRESLPMTAGWTCQSQLVHAKVLLFFSVSIFYLDRKIVIFTLS